MRRVGIRIGSQLLLLSLCFAGPALAEWHLGGISASLAFPVSDGSGGLICGAAPTKRTALAGAVQWTASLTVPPAVFASDRSGGEVFAAVAGVNGDIYAQRVNSTGAVPWGLVSVCILASAQNQPNIAADAAGNTFIVWHDERGGAGTNQYFAQKLNSSGAPQWAANGVLVNSIGVAFTAPTAIPVPDEAGGCYFLWEDSRGGTLGPADLYAQRLTSAGTPAWVAGGLPFCIAAGQQFFIRAIPNGSGGLIALWMDQRSGDFDLYAQRLDAAGASQWAANGVPIASGSGDQNQPVMIEDGAGGAFVTWTDARNSGVTGTDIYAQHVDGTGASLWTANGAVLANTAVPETNANITTDGSGGAIIAWQNGSSILVGHLNGAGASTWEPAGIEFPGGTPTLLITDGVGGAYVGGGGLLARVLPTGEQSWVPNYRAIISSVADVRADEGGWVSVGITKPPSDGTVLSPPTSGYSLWRKQPDGTAPAARLVDEHRVLPRSVPIASLEKYSDFPPGHWDAVAYTPAIQAATYSFLAPTHTDSSAQGAADDSFLVVAHTSIAFVVSAKAGGHSVDNLAPGPPQGVTGGSAGGTVALLQWSANHESDVWHYSVYKGTTSSFVPSVGNRIGQPTSSAFQDDAFQSGVSHYKISAVDRHGNESGFTLLSPSQITSVPPGTIPARAYLARPSPNPSRAESAFEYGVAQEGRVSLVVYDLRGRRVTRLVEEVQAPGVRRAIWNGLDEAHRRVPAGTYLVRFVANGVTERAKLIRTN